MRIKMTFLNAALIKRWIKRQIQGELEQKEIEINIREERYALAAEASHDGLWDWNIALGQIFYSKRWNEMIGLEEGDLMGDKALWLSRVHPENIEKLLYHLEAGLKSKAKKNYQCEYRLLNKNAQYLWMVSKWVTVFNHKNQLIRMVGSQSNIETNKKLEGQLVHDAMHDFLTQLPNRNLLNDRLHQVLLRFKRSRLEDFALILIDIDNFKYINDSMGHPVGDKLLIQIGKSLMSIIRDSDTVSRLGGDEFAVIIQNPVDKSSFNMMITRMANVLSSPVKIDNYLINPSVSMGITWCRQDAAYKRVEDIFRDADLALYQAKKTGKSKFIFYDDNLRREAQERFRISNHLKTALNKNEFSVYFQPVVETKTGQFVGVESLLRWHHPELGFVLPGQFIPVAEDNHVIVDLGNYVIQESCKMLSQLMEKYNPERNWYVSINVSAKQLESDHILFELDRAIKDNFLKYHHVKIEVTESVLLKGTDSELYVLEALHKKGVQIAIDDFGTGYSSLSTLHHFPFSYLKIDKSFIVNMATDFKVQSMIKSIILMAKVLDMKIIVEGVEYIEQYNIIKNMEADYIQGFYFSQPLPITVLQEFIQKSLFPLDWLDKKITKKII